MSAPKTRPKKKPPESDSPFYRLAREELPPRLFESIAPLASRSSQERRPVREGLEKFLQGRADREAASNEGAASDASRRIYEGMAEACEAYFRQTIPPRSSERQEQFPPEIALILSALLKNFLAGHLDQSVRELVERPGARGRVFMEQEDISAAVRYLQAVEKRLIPDRTPVQRVAEWYKVNRATAQKWRREETRDLIGGFWPEAAPSTRAELITEGAKRSGERHGRAGRGQKAIAIRRAKQV